MKKTSVLMLVLVLLNSFVSISAANVDYYCSRFRNPRVKAIAQGGVLAAVYPSKKPYPSGKGAHLIIKTSITSSDQINLTGGLEGAWPLIGPKFTAETNNSFSKSQVFSFYYDVLLKTGSLARLALYKRYIDYRVTVTNECLKKDVSTTLRDFISVYAVVECSNDGRNWSRCPEGSYSFQ